MVCECERRCDWCAERLLLVDGFVVLCPKCDFSKGGG